MVGSILRLTASALVTAVIAVVAVLILPLNRTGRMYHRVGRFWSRTLLRICGVRVRLHGAEHVSGTGTRIYAANHASMFDIPVVIGGLPDDIRLVYKKELERIPVFGWGLKWGSYIGIDRGRGAEARRSLEEAIRKIQHGASVLLFVEGTRSADGKLQQFKRGAFHLAARAGVPVVPMTINGTFTIVPKHSLRIRPGTVDVILSPPILVEGEGTKDAELELMQQVRAAIEQNHRLT